MNKCKVCQQINNNLRVICNQIQLYLAQAILNLKGFKDSLDSLIVCENCKQGLDTLQVFWQSIPEAKPEEVATELLELNKEIENTNENFIKQDDYDVKSSENLKDLTDLKKQTHFKEEITYEPIKIRIKLPTKRKRQKIVATNEIIDNGAVESKRLRRLPKRYEDFKLNLCQKSNENQNIYKDVDNTTTEEISLATRPIMALIRFPDNIRVIGKLLEIESNGISSRIRIICELCLKIFRFEKEFCKHLKNHDPLILEEESYLFYCSLCDKSFADHIAVRRHYRLSHTEERPLKCQYCDASFKYKFNMDYHMAKHINKKRFECVFCKKSFLYRYELQIHLRTHTKEKPFKCELCSWAFAHRSNLKAHQKTKHFKDSKTVSNLKHTSLEEETLPTNENLNNFKVQNFNTNTEEKILLDNTNSSSDITFPHNFQDFSSHLKNLETTELTSNNSYDTPSSSLFENEEQIKKPNSKHENPQQTINKAVERFKAPGNFATLHIDESILKVLNSSDLLGLKKWPKYYQNTSTIQQTNDSMLRKCDNNLETYSKLQKPERNTEKSTNIHNETKDLNDDDVKFKHLVTSCSTSLKENSTLTSNCCESNTLNSSYSKTLTSSFTSTTTPNLKSLKIDNKKARNFQVPSSSILTKDSKFINIIKFSNSTNNNHVNDDESKVKNENIDSVPTSHKNITLTSKTNASNSSTATTNSNNKDTRIFQVPSSSILTKPGKFINITKLASTNTSPVDLKHLGNVKHIEIIDKNIKISKDKSVTNSAQSNDINVCSSGNSKSKHNTQTWNVIKVSPRPVKVIKISNLNKYKTKEANNANFNKQQKIITNSNQISAAFKHNSPIRSAISKVPAKSSISTKSLLKPLQKKQEIFSTTSNQELSLSSNKPLITNIEILPPLQTLQTSTTSSRSYKISVSKSFEFTTPKADQLYKNANNQELNAPENATTRSVAITTNSSLNPQNLIKPPAAYKYQCPHCWKYFKQKSPLNKHLRTHTGEKPYKCNLCPKSYADASNYKKHKILHKNAAEALNITRTTSTYAVAASPAYSTVSDPDPDGIEVMQTIKKFVNSSTDDDDDDDDGNDNLAEVDDVDDCSLSSATMESCMWQDALQNILINDDIRENIKRNLMGLNNAIMPKSIQQNSTNKINMNQIFSSEDPD